MFQDNKVRNAIRGNGSKDLFRVSGRAVLFPRAVRGGFEARETQIELNRLFGGLRMAFSQVVNGE